MSVVGVDIDEVLAEYAATFCEFHNKRYGTNVSMKEAKAYSFWRNFNTTDADIRNKMNEFHETEEFKLIPPVPGAKEHLATLPVSKIIAITVRSNEIESQTKTWLETHFKGKVQAVHFARNIHAGEQTNKTKADYCHEAGVRVMIEDSLENAKDCAQAGIPTILLDKPWNQGQLPPNVIRVHSWKEIPQVIKSVLK